MKKKDSQNEKLMFEIAQENKRLSEPLQKVGFPPAQTFPPPPLPSPPPYPGPWYSNALTMSLQAVKEVDSLRAMVGNYEKDKAALTQSKARLLQSEKHLKHLEWENEVCSSRTVLLGFVESML